MNIATVDSHSSTIFNNISKDEVYLETLTIDALPTIPLSNRLDLLSFNFLLFGIKENQLRKAINLSRTTEKFWETFRTIPKFNSTFSYYSNKELANTFKYIFYLPINSKFLPSLVIKVFFTLKENNLFSNDISLADVSKALMFYLKKNHSTLNSVSKSKKPSKLNSNVTSLIQKINIRDLFINVKSDDNTQNLSLLENSTGLIGQDLDRNSHDTVLQSSLCVKGNIDDLFLSNHNNNLMEDAKHKIILNEKLQKINLKQDKTSFANLKSSFKKRRRVDSVLNNQRLKNPSSLSLTENNNINNTVHDINYDHSDLNVDNYVEMIQVTNKSIENCTIKPLNNDTYEKLPKTKIVFYSSQLDTFKDDFLNQINNYFKQKNLPNVSFNEEKSNMMFSIKDKLSLSNCNMTNSKFSGLRHRQLNKNYTYENYVSCLKEMLSNKELTEDC